MGRLWLWCFQSTLGSYPGVGKALKKVHERMPVTWKRGYFAGVLRLKLRDKSRQFRVGHARMPMMNAMKWLVKETQGHEPSQQSL
jgi:type 1 glutamine amidotransferase